MVERTPYSYFARAGAAVERAFSYRNTFLVRYLRHFRRTLIFARPLYRIPRNELFARSNRAGVNRRTRLASYTSSTGAWNRRKVVSGAVQQVRTHCRHRRRHPGSFRCLFARWPLFSARHRQRNREKKLSLTSSSTSSSASALRRVSDVVCARFLGRSGLIVKTEQRWTVKIIRD